MQKKVLFVLSKSTSNYTLKVLSSEVINLIMTSPGIEPRTPTCKTDALLTELQPHIVDFIQNNYFLICSTYNALTISVYLVRLRRIWDKAQPNCQLIISFIYWFFISFILYKYYIKNFNKNQIVLFHFK